MRTKALQDLADRMPEVAATGLEQVRRGGRIVAERAPVAVGEGVNRLTDLADRAGVPVPARLEALGRKRSRSMLSARRGLPAILAAIVVLALVKVVRTRRAGTAAAEDEPTQAAAEDRNSMPPYTRVAGPRAGEPSDAAARGSRGH